jgi:hypothetical protein
MPRTKTPKRYKHLQPRLSPETGTWAAGIRNSEMLSLFGDIVSAWVHVEESMIEVMEMLVFFNHDVRRFAEQRANGFLPGRQIFRSMSANGVRVKTMLNLLQTYVGNDNKDPLFDHTIREFQSLVRMRNDYLHGLWWTKENGNIYLQTENVDELAFNRKRRFGKAEFESFLERVGKLLENIGDLAIKEYEASNEKKEDDARLAASAKAPR